MISISGRQWQEKKVNKRLVEKIQQNYNFSKIISQLIVSRNFDKNEIHLIKNDLELTNIFQNNPDFINSVKLIEKVMKNKGLICVLGDYDVDGSVATSLFSKFFESLDYPYFYYIPDRIKDGYGATKKLFQKIILKKPKLIVMVDCGSTSNEAIDFLNKNNIDSIIIDHHEIYQPFPKANFIINPKKNEGYSKYDYLCAATLSYFFLEMLIIKLKCKVNLRKYLIYVLLATVCDVMPLRKFNRLISIKALKEFNLTENQVFISLYELNNKKNKININDLAYLIGPILNSGGRLGKSNYATELLSTNKIEVINKLSKELNNLNKKRKNIENAILKDIDFKKFEKIKDEIIIYVNPNINEGLIGIISARLKEYLNKPSIVITNSNNIMKGSARSVYSYNIGKAVKRSLDKNLIINGGGHNMAAGFSLKKENLSKFQKFIKEDYLKNNNFVSNNFEYDAEISPSIFKNDFFTDLKKMGPFGNGNPLPIFFFKNLKVIKSSILIKKHISCILKTKSGNSINAIAFDTFNREIGKYLLNYKKNFNVMGHIYENFWNNKKTLQLIIKDIIL
tara:strand:- start:2459 stop:4153 length:1695 start_codon:yes stop_codon:yes gene_type:complete